MEQRGNGNAVGTLDINGDNNEIGIAQGGPVNQSSQSGNNNLVAMGVIDGASNIIGIRQWNDDNMAVLNIIGASDDNIVSILQKDVFGTGGEAIVTALDAIADGDLPATRQPEEGVTYAAKLSKAEAELDFTRPAAELDARIRAFNPWPVAWTRLDGEPLRLWMSRTGEQRLADFVPPGTLLAPGNDCLRIACGDGRQVLEITRAQLPGAKPLSVKDLLNSRAARFPEGLVLGADHAPDSDSQTETSA